MTASARGARLRDALLLACTSSALTIAVVLTVARVLSGPVIEAALQRKTIPLIGVFAAVALLAGAGFVLSSPPGASPPDLSGRR